MTQERAWAFITSGRRLLVFDQPERWGGGVQVPGGRLDPGEEPVAGVVREAREETGFGALSVVRALGSEILDWGGYTSTIYAFHLVFTEPVPERWEHGEFMNDEPIPFAFRWIDLDEASTVLWPSQAHFVPALMSALGLEVE